MTVRASTIEENEDIYIYIYARANLYPEYGIVIPYPSPPSFAGAPTRIRPTRPVLPLRTGFTLGFFFSRA